MRPASWCSRPVAPAVSKSLHSSVIGHAPKLLSGCPRSLQVATFVEIRSPMREGVRLPPQSPSRYIRARRTPSRRSGPVAPAVSKSLHSRTARQAGRSPSGCPRSLQVATFSLRFPAQGRSVRLPPQSPSRYIPGSDAARCSSSPVAPAVSKSLHSNCAGTSSPALSGCPRSLQVATFVFLRRPPEHPVRLPPQSPSRYIQAERNSLFGLNLFAFDRRSTHRYKAVRLERAYDGFQSPVAGPVSGRVSPESHEAIVTISAWS